MEGSMKMRSGYNPSNDDLLGSIETKVDMLKNHLEALLNPNNPAMGLDENDPRLGKVYVLLQDVKYYWLEFERELQSESDA
jgi:hypothetical protein